MHVAIIGTGYVGLTTGAALTYLGHRVVAVDKDSDKIQTLQRGKSPFHEQGMEELLARADSPISFTGDTVAAVAKADLIINS